MNLNQVTILSQQVAKSVEFYTTLGLRLIVDSAPRYVRFECPKGKSTFSIHHSDNIEPNANVTIYFECDDLDDQVRLLKEYGIKFDIEPTDQEWNWREAHLTDPNGHKLILYHAGENRKNPPWRIE